MSGVDGAAARATASGVASTAAEGTPSTTGTMGSDVGWLRRAAASVRWYVRGVTGSDAYDNYLRCHAARGSHDEPLSEKEFWRDKYDRQERNPQGRCC